MWSTGVFVHGLETRRESGYGTETCMHSRVMGVLRAVVREKDRPSQFGNGGEKTKVVFQTKG
jgi:hypothetical protein